jgi:hypothetical protein
VHCRGAEVLEHYVVPLLRSPDTTTKELQSVQHEPGLPIVDSPGAPTVQYRYFKGRRLDVTPLVVASSIPANWAHQQLMPDSPTPPLLFSASFDTTRFTYVTSVLHCQSRVLRRMG